MYGHIYKTTNLINGKIYIGQTIKHFESEYLGSGTNISKAIKKYGRKNFKKELLRNCKSQKELDVFEGFFIGKFNSIDEQIGYNILPGTSNKFGAVNPASLPSVKLKMSIARTGTKRTLESRKKQAISRTGMKHSEETKKKMSLSAMGLQRILGFKDTDETKQIKRGLAKKHWEIVREEYEKTDKVLNIHEFRKVLKTQNKLVA